MTQEHRRWRDRWAEGATIVVSILLALLADAAWGYWMDRVEERELLTGLQAEFGEAAAEISNDIDAREEIVRHTDLLLAARAGDGPRPPVDSIPVILVDLLNWRFYTPVHAVLDDAVVSGRLDLIRSRVIRESLMTYLQARDRMPVFDQLERDFATAQLEPYLGARVPLDRITGEAGGLTPDSAEAERFFRLLDEDGFGSLLHIRRDRTEQALVYARAVARAIDGARTALAGAS